MNKRSTTCGLNAEKNDINLFSNDHTSKCNLANHTFTSSTIDQPEKCTFYDYSGFLLQSQIKKVPIFKTIFHLNNLTLHSPSNENHAILVISRSHIVNTVVGAHLLTELIKKIFKIVTAETKSTFHMFFTCHVFHIIYRTELIALQSYTQNCRKAVTKMLFQ